MTRQTVERATCDWGSDEIDDAPDTCDNEVATPGQGELKPTGWMFGETVNMDETLDLCPQHASLVMRMARHGGLPDDVEL